MNTTFYTYTRPYTYSHVIRIPIAKRIRCARALRSKPGALSEERLEVYET